MLSRQYAKFSNRCATISLCIWCCLIPSVNADIRQLELPPGFSIDVYSDGVSNARQMALGANGTIFVGSRRAGNVYAVVDSDRDYRADKVITIARGLQMPSGIAFHKGALYVAAVNRILRYDDIEAHLESPPDPVLVSDDLPAEQHHGWKFIRFANDGRLYVPVGVPCNICELDNPVFGTILSLDLSSNRWTTEAKGVRNSVGFDWHPETGELWFSENGRDNLGDDVPPCEINRVTQTGQHFGFPYVYGDNLPQPEFKDRELGDYQIPALNLQAHVAPLGVHFYRGEMFPEAYRNALFVAEHGSWNRSRKVGYRVMAASIAGNKVTSYQPFVTGWLQGESVSGRPVAFLELGDGSLLVSDDHNGAIYRISYKQEN